MRKEWDNEDNEDNEDNDIWLPLKEYVELSRY
jgi:hypothetical protein